MVIVYDGECPFCRNYVRLMELRKAVGNVDLVNARTPHPAVWELVELGYDLNEGMAAIYGGKIYYGSDAVVLLSSMTKRAWLGGPLPRGLASSPCPGKIPLSINESWPALCAQDTRQAPDLITFRKTPGSRLN